METKTKLRLGVAAAALAGCAVGGLTLGPAFAGAVEGQDDPTTTTEPQATDQAPADGTAPADGERCGPGGRFPFLRDQFETAAETIGIEPSALREALVAGQTIAQVAEANGVDPQAVIDALVANAQEQLAQAVEDGRITQERADEISANLNDRITNFVNEVHPFHDGPGHHGPRGPLGEDAPADDAPADDSTS